MSRGRELEQSPEQSSQTFVARDFDEFLINIDNLGPKAVLVKIVQEPVVDEEGEIIGVAEFSFHTQGERKDLYREETRRGREDRAARSRIRMIMSMFPQVKIRPIEQPIQQRLA